MSGGFEAITRLTDAREQLRDCCRFHGRHEEVPIEEAVGHVLADSIRAKRPVPHYDRAAMDGYAVCARNTFAAGERSPVRLNTVADSVADGQAVPVHTGGVLPDGADAVVMVEHTEQRGGELLVYDAVASGENVSPVGEDIESGQQLFEGGDRLVPSDVSLARATAIQTVECVQSPRVSVLPTGEELVGTDVTPEPGEIVETNGLLVSMLTKRWDGQPTYRNIVTDDEDCLQSAIKRDTDHDVVVTTGGSSVGDRDLVTDVVADAGDVVVHGVAIKPGHPVGFGIVDETPVLMLPGYPVSCLVTAVQFLRPAIAWCAGTTPQSHPILRGRLTGKLRSAPGERTFARVRLVEEDNEIPNDGETLPGVEPVQSSGASVMSSVAVADGWVEIPESREGIPAEETVSVQQWDV